ncbi:hypothetical protein AAHH80_35785, partial [Burkholderia pseudomallei]
LCSEPPPGPAMPVTASATCARLLLSGFRSDVQLRRVFMRRLGVTPGAYREGFSGTGVREARGSGDVDCCGGRASGVLGVVGV